MKEIPILYSTAMIQAKLAGRKSQTRRTTKLDFINQNPDEWMLIELKVHKGHLTAVFGGEDSPKILTEIKCPYGQPGALLWARETFYKAVAPDGESYPAYYFKTFDGHDYSGDIGIKWKPSIHMPKAAARIWDRVVSIRVERLQDIREEDAIAEGIQELIQSRAQRAENGRMFRDYSKKPEMFNDGLSAIKSYHSLWTKINGPGSWESNPWVWVITTENLSLTGKPEN